MHFPPAYRVKTVARGSYKSAINSTYDTHLPSDRIRKKMMSLDNFLTSPIGQRTMAIDERRVYEDSGKSTGGRTEKEESKRTRVDRTIRTSRPIILQLDVV